MFLNFLSGQWQVGGYHYIEKMKPILQNTINEVSVEGRRILKIINHFKNTLICFINSGSSVLAGSACLALSFFFVCLFPGKQSQISAQSNLFLQRVFFLQLICKWVSESRTLRSATWCSVMCQGQSRHRIRVWGQGGRRLTVKTWVGMTFLGGASILTFHIHVLGLFK